MTNDLLVYMNRIIKEIPQSIINSNQIGYCHLKSKYQLHKVFLEIIKSTMLNELEVVYFKIFLEKFGWETEGIPFEENLLILCLEVKVLVF